MAKKGRPTKYDPKYCKMLVDYFNIPPYKIEEIKVTTYSGSSYKNKKKVPNDLRFFSAFGRKIGHATSTMDQWVKAQPDFAEAWKKAKELQRELLITNCMNGLFDRTFGIFTAKNITDMRDQQDIRHEGTVIVKHRAWNSQKKKKS